MSTCFFVSDLHGSGSRYRTLLRLIEQERPAAVFVGGDLLPHPAGVRHTIAPAVRDFDLDRIHDGFAELRADLGDTYPAIFVILGNDDPRSAESLFVEGEAEGLWTYMHMRCSPYGEFTVCGYACIPPSPFQLKDWERYDVSRFVDPGCVSPEDGFRTIETDPREVRQGTIQKDLDQLLGEQSLDRSILLFHSPPYKSKLDRAALDGRMVDHVPVDVHVGSIAIERLIKQRQPLITLHGHIHESARLTGDWQEQIGATHAFSAAHDGEELAVVTFDPAHPENATRRLL